MTTRHMISLISFEEIFPIWRNYLWPNRQDKIEPHSAMLFLKGYDLKNFNNNPSFFGYFIDDRLVGVNSGHKCCDNSYRSRGLYVDPNYRKSGIGKKLLTATIQQGKKECADFVWSYPKQSSWKCYESSGFKLSSNWLTSENGINAYCILTFNELPKIIS